MIGGALLSNNSFDYDKTAKQIHDMSITNIVSTDDVITIETSRPGLLIGHKGKTFELIERLFPGKKLEVVESFSWADLITPYDLRDLEDNNCSDYRFPMESEIA